ncbi:NAD-dependent epimerase/dehydratase family protein [Aurantiacibacter poecillastricola]|uniref:NAD-dependent epimerase/dehydratase family protein n=1 Tax=Aurantiacibacter poecillastricola TaxID=3064385 RepID=UPI00273FBB1D|nr:NAD(P)-dependent oxidoreductase [Aurantiacibacter sp. 219JJ12-13]MDP5259983.1 NAD(P)-dependent oxidoreductase [Aurantiacibacter sp. 219JJ12-13]
MTNNAIVTGGSGFLGSVLVEHLVRDGWTVHNLDLQYPKSNTPAVMHHAVDVIDKEQLEALSLPRGAHVIHLAGRQYNKPVKRRDRARFFREGNVEGTRNVLALARRLEAASFSFVSTDMVYGKPQRTPVDKDHPRKPFGPYGESKVAAEDLIASKDLPFRVMVYRPRLIVGPGRFGLMTKLFAAIRHNRPVPMIGSGTNTYQMISVFDCADAIVRGIAREDAQGVFNLGSEPRWASKDLIETLIARAGSRSPVVPLPSALLKPVLRVLDRFDLSPLVPEQFEIADQHYVLDVSEANERLGWYPVHGDDEMMIAAYEEYCASFPEAEAVRPSLRDSRSA